MKKALLKRLSYYAFYAALAGMFWLFDFTILAWVFGALVILPLLIGFTIILKNYYKKS